MLCLLAKAVAPGSSHFPPSRSAAIRKVLLVSCGPNELTKICSVFGGSATLISPRAVVEMSVLYHFRIDGRGFALSYSDVLLVTVPWYMGLPKHLGQL